MLGCGGVGMVPVVDPMEERQKPRVLLIEDEVLIRAFLAEELRDKDIDVVEAGTADEAWAYIDAGGSADLVFSDVQMPGSMNGMDFARRLRQRDPTMPILLTSSGHIPLADELAIAPFLPKPYSADVAVERILETLAAKRR